MLFYYTVRSFWASTLAEVTYEFGSVNPSITLSICSAKSNLGSGGPAKSPKLLKNEVFGNIYKDLIHSCVLFYFHIKVLMVF